MGILETAQPATKVTAQSLKLKVLLVGDSGTGKTTGACTLPGKKLLVDLDGRSESIAGIENVSVVKIIEPRPEQPRAWLDLETLKEEIWLQVRQDKFPHDSLIIDGISSMCKYAMNWSLMLTGADGKLMGRAPGGGAAMPHYAPAMNRLDRTINSLLALPINVLFTAHVDLYEDEHLKTLTFYPKIIGKLRSEISNWFNETYLTKTSRGGDGETKYYWLTKSGGDRTPFIKSALNQFGKFWNDPIAVDFNKKSKGFELLLEKRFGTKK